MELAFELPPMILDDIGTRKSYNRRMLCPVSSSAYQHVYGLLFQHANVLCYRPAKMVLVYEQGTKWIGVGSGIDCYNRK